MNKLICINSTNCLRLKNTCVKKGKAYYYNESKVKDNGEIYLYYRPFYNKNPKLGYLGIYDIKDFLTEKEYNEYKIREDKLNSILDG